MSAIDDLKVVIENLARRIRALETLESRQGNLSSTQALYFGDSSTDGSWRIIRDGTDLKIELREVGVWVTKDTITP